MNKSSSWRIFDRISPSYDRLNRILSLGIDRYWRNQLIKKLPVGNAIECIDLATGTADVAIKLAQQPNVKRVTGLDLSKEMLKIGQDKINKKLLNDKIDLKHGDGAKIPLPDKSVDVVAVSFGVRNFSDYEESLNNSYRVLKSGGRLIILEFSLPKSRFLRKLYLLYLRNIVPFIGKIISKDAFAYRYLNETIESFPYGHGFAKKMIEAGFKNVSFKPLNFGIAALYWGDK